MYLDYQNLNDETRQIMLSEIRADAQNGRLYMSKRLSERGQTDYPNLLEVAAEKHDDEWLGDQLTEHRRIKESETTKLGKVKHTPHDAHETLAMGEFNSYYIRALCLRAISESRSIVIYRARQNESPRPESEAAIGQNPNPQLLLEALRLPIEQRPRDVIPKPNSGLTIKFK